MQPLKQALFLKSNFYQMNDKQVDIKSLNKKIEKESAFVDLLQIELGKVIVGQQHMLERLLIGLLGEGHILLEGVPGLAKTLAINSLSKGIKASFSRVQITPALLPADGIGTMIYKIKENAVSIKKGPYPLPEAQVDRFMLKVIIDYPNKTDEQQIVRAQVSGATNTIKPVVTTAQVIKAQKAAREVYMDEKIEKYIIDLIFATRFPEQYGLEDLKPLISFGASPRGSINLTTSAKCYAFIKRRGYVVPEDVRAVVHDVLRHRIGITYEAEAENITSEDIINRIVNVVEVP